MLGSLVASGSLVSQCLLGSLVFMVHKVFILVIFTIFFANILAVRFSITFEVFYDVCSPHPAGGVAIQGNNAPPMTAQGQSQATMKGPPTLLLKESFSGFGVVYTGSEQCQPSYGDTSFMIKSACRSSEIGRSVKIVRQEHRSEKLCGLVGTSR